MLFFFLRLYQIILPVHNLLTHIVIEFIQPMAMFISSRGRKIVFNLFLGTVFLYGLFILYQSYNAYLFRRHPGKLIANNYFESLAPHQIIPRMILYVPGSKEYNAHIVYLSNKINNRLDCVFINKIERSAKKELIVEMASSMNDFGGCVANSILSDKRLNIEDLSNVNIDNIIIDAIKYQNNNIYLVDFIDRNLVNQYNVELFENIIPYVSAIENNIDYVYLFNKYYKNVQLENKRNLIRNFSIIFNKKNINTFKNFYDSNSTLFSEEEKKYLIYALMLKTESLDKTWFNQRLSNIKNCKLLYDSHYLYHVDNGTFDYFRETGYSKNDIKKLILLAKELESIDQHASSLVYHILIHRIEDDVSIWVAKNFNECIADYYHCSENEDFDKWLEKSGEAYKKEKDKMLSKQQYKQIFIEINRILNSPSDSELKKNMIVLAYRSVDVLEIYPNNVDEAFSGSEPRSMLFRNIEDYLTGSNVITEYEMITEHKYMSTASLWPLSSYSRNDSNYIQTKYNKWKKLINKYPWHPSIDDMYLRLAFDQFNLKQYTQGVNEITQYFSKKNRLDKSSDTRLRVLLLYYLKKMDKNSLIGEYKVLKDVYNIPYCLFNKNCVMPSSSDINILRQNETVMDSSIVSDNQLKTIEKMLLLSKNEIFIKARHDDLYKSILYDIALIRVKTPKYIGGEMERSFSETCLSGNEAEADIDASADADATDIDASSDADIHIDFDTDADADGCNFFIEPIYGNKKKSTDIEDIKKKLDFNFGDKPDSNL